MRYTKPNILFTEKATIAIQNGTGRTAHGQSKKGINPDNPNGPNPQLIMSTSSAYEADE
jgi:hypothetical protein